MTTHQTQPQTSEIAKIVNYTQNRIDNWYSNAKEEYGVVGSAKVNYNVSTNTFEINGIENGKKTKFSLWNCDGVPRIEYVFDVWMEEFEVVENSQPTSQNTTTMTTQPTQPQTARNKEIIAEAVKALNTLMNPNFDELEPMVKSFVKKNIERELKEGKTSKQLQSEFETELLTCEPKDILQLMYAIELLKPLTVGQAIQCDGYRLVVTAIKETKQAETQENEAIIKALKKISGTKWVGNTIHDTLDKCLTAINLNSTNSGWYNPKAKRIPGLTGIYMINQDDSIFCEARIIKESAKQYRIEYLTKTGWNEFERLYSQFINDKL